MNVEFVVAYVLCIVYMIYFIKFSKNKIKNFNDYRNWTLNMYNYRPLMFCLILFIGGTVFIIYKLIKKMF